LKPPAGRSSPELGIVLLDYQTPDQTIRYIRGVLSKIKRKHLLVVVNNTDDPQIAKTIAKAVHGAVFSGGTPLVRNPRGRYVLTTGSNLGYARGNNVGYQFLKKYFRVRHILFTNNDISMKDPENIILKLWEAMEGDPKIGAAGPAILGGDHLSQNPHHYRGLGRRTLSHLLNPLVVLVKLLVGRSFDYSAVQNMKSGFCYRLSGAFILIREKCFRACGGFDENTFLYSEESIFSERMREAGYGSYFCRTPPLFHEEGRTARKYIQLKEKLRMELESGRRPWRREPWLLGFTSTPIYPLTY
jgi:GT2 family glycosyltransferase